MRASWGTCAVLHLLYFPSPLLEEKEGSGAKQGRGMGVGQKAKSFPWCHGLAPASNQDGHSLSPHSCK